jgi:hypothetical protein
MIFKGPKMMKNRRAFEVKKSMVVYNIIQVAANAVVLITVGFKFLIIFIFFFLLYFLNN